MRHVLSLIADEAKTRLGEGDIAAVLGTLADATIECGAPDWLSPDEACDIAFDGAPESALSAARAALSDKPFDINVVATKSRRKRLLIADMDSTLIEQECIDELAAAAGRGPEVAAVTERVMRGELEFEPALRQRVLLLKGLTTEVAASVLAQRIAIVPGAEILVATMRKSGAYTALVSGGFTMFAQPIGERLGFDEHRANTLLAADGAFTGIVAEPILGRAAKEDALFDLIRRLDLDLAETLAVGDGANDIAMIRLAGLGVAFRGKPALRAVANATIDHADLTALLFLQGYRREEFVGSCPHPAG